MSKDSLKVGEFIEKWGSLISKNGKVTLQLQDDENFVLYDRVDGSPDKAVWSSNTGLDTFINKGIMQDDGNFVLYDHNKNAKWSTGTNGKGDKSSFLYVADEGNAFIYFGGKEIWRARVQSVREPPPSAVPKSVPQPNVAQPAKPSPAAVVAPPVEYIATVPLSTTTALSRGPEPGAQASDHVTQWQGLAGPAGRWHFMYDIQERHR